MNPYSDFSFNLASAFLQSHAKETACVSPVSLLLPLAAVAAAAASPPLPFRMMYRPV